MKTSTMKASLAALGVMLSPALAQAATDGPFDRVIDKSNKSVVDSRGNCVRTKWMSASDECGAEPKAAAPQKVAVSKAERTVYFDFNKSTIRPSEKTKLDSLINTIRSSKEVQSVDIYGHADQIGATGYNQKLSLSRAEAVKRYLASKGGLQTRNVELKALGESQSVTNCAGNLPREKKIACLAEDRRVEIELNYAK